MYSTTEKSGFTLFEILVALVISSVIMLGLLELFKSVIDAKVFSQEHSRKMELVTRTIRLMESDIFSSTGNMRIEQRFGVTRLVINTTHSLLFANSLPVSVYYYIEENNGKKTLIREEINEKAGEDMIIPLTDMFDSINFMFYSNGRWGDEPSDLVRITLHMKNGKSYSFAARSMSR